MNPAGRTHSDTKVSSIPLSNCFASGLLVIWQSRIQIRAGRAEGYSQ